jgi:hypothetical protein
MNLSYKKIQHVQALRIAMFMRVLQLAYFFHRGVFEFLRWSAKRPSRLWEVKIFMNLLAQRMYMFQPTANFKDLPWLSQNVKTQSSAVTNDAEPIAFRRHNCPRSGMGRFSCRTTSIRPPGCTGGVRSLRWSNEFLNQNAR